MESKVTTQLILNLSTKCICVVCFTTQLLYTEKRGPIVPTKMLAGLASEPFWMTWKGEKSRPQSGMKPQFLGKI